MKRILLSLLTVMFVFGMAYPSMSANASTSNAEDQSCDLNDIISSDQTKKQSIDENGIQTIEITDPETLKEIESNLDKPYPDKELKSFVIKQDTNVQQNPNEQSEVNPQFITSLQQTGSRDACGSTPIGHTTGVGDISLSVSEAVSTEISGGAGVDTGLINAELGTSISSTQTVTASASYNAQDDGAPAGTIGVIDAYPTYTFTDYDIYRFGINSGSGTVQYGTGVCFAKYY